MRLIFVRHGEPNYENDCLTDLGRRQAEAAARRLAGEGIDEIWSSPYGRALETAEISADQLGVGPVRLLDGLRELRWGGRDGREIFAKGHPWTIADTLSQEGWDLTDPAWRAHPYFVDNLVVDETDRVARATDEWLAGLGYIREGAAYRCAAENHRTVALFAHGGSGAAFFARILNWTFPYAVATLHFHLTGISILRFDPRAGSRIAPSIELMNDGTHIKDLPSLIP